ncbi:MULTISPECIES: class I SAM-dependent methyltransferase [Bacillaceae]|uniref:class I SAM-dependent methyltransferase n=1 Tax=Bacillaceae TaxID=186817 RepID=UPI00104AA152|nr:MULTISPECIES: class I SAM-dependent methyltransferase [Bacillaceae]MDT2047251.1 class I SAM-dependent methyltransferase [Priestia flexa]TDB55005.1 hypothetical protein EPL02_02065 [Bacillus sp. CBEL-1]
MIVTTAGRTDEEMISFAKSVANDLHIPYVARAKASVKTLQNKEKSNLLVVGKERMELHIQEVEEPFFFHPNSAMFRAKRLLKGEQDPFVQATKLTAGMSVLDCTLGLASDSIIASLITGESGLVKGLEGNRFMAYLLKHGLKTWKSGICEIDEAMNRISVVHQTFETYLHCCEDNSFDIVYFDPMFEANLSESNGIQGLKQLALYTPLTEEVITQAKRVARKRVVLKDHYKSTRFLDHQFHVYKRKTAAFHYGVIEINESR